MVFAQLLTLRRDDENIPWGFRLDGGFDIGRPLTVLRVLRNGAAEAAGLEIGDRILSINDVDVTSLSHAQANDLMKTSCQNIYLQIVKADSCSDPQVLENYTKPVYTPSDFYNQNQNLKTNAPPQAQNVQPDPNNHSTHKISPNHANNLARVNNTNINEAPLGKPQNLPVEPAYHNLAQPKIIAKSSSPNPSQNRIVLHRGAGQQSNRTPLNIKPPSSSYSPNILPQSVAGGAPNYRIERVKKENTPQAFNDQPYSALPSSNDYNHAHALNNTQPKYNDLSGRSPCRSPGRNGAKGRYIDQNDMSRNDSPYNGYPSNQNTVENISVSPGYGNDHAQNGDKIGKKPDPNSGLNLHKPGPTPINVNYNSKDNPNMTPKSNGYGNEVRDPHRNGEDNKRIPDAVSNLSMNADPKRRPWTYAPDKNIIEEHSRRIRKNLVRPNHPINRSEFSRNLNRRNVTTNEQRRKSEDDEKEVYKPFNEKAYLAGRIPLVKGGPIDPSVFTEVDKVPLSDEREIIEEKESKPFDENAYLEGRIAILGDPIAEKLPKKKKVPTATLR